MARSGKITWRVPSNIALVKYWGKNGFQIPLNPSISMTLSNCYTETSITYREKGKPENGTEISFYFDGKKKSEFEERINIFLKSITDELPLVRSLSLHIESRNSFPASAGIASSASSFSSLAFCLLSIQQEISGIPEEKEIFYRRASLLARLGSGSACRSAYGGWVLWGKTFALAESSDYYAIPLNDLAHQNFNNYYDAILVIDPSPKKISSSIGHKLMKANPYRNVRIETAQSNAKALIKTLQNGDEKAFSSVIENETANLHAMILTSDPMHMQIMSGTLEIVNRIIKFRKETGLSIGFSIDAGPNVHLLYPGKSRDSIIRFIELQLSSLCRDGYWIDDTKGNGPVQINI